MTSTMTMPSNLVNPLASPRAPLATNDSAGESFTTAYAPPPSS